MAKKTTRQQVEETLQRAERERDYQYRILDAMLRGVAPDAIERAPIYAPGPKWAREAECRMSLFGATRADGGIVLCEYSYTDGSPMKWCVHRLDDNPFPELMDYSECRYAWDRLLHKRRELMDGT